MTGFVVRSQLQHPQSDAANMCHLRDPKLLKAEGQDGQTNGMSGANAWEEAAESNCSAPLCPFVPYLEI